MNFIELDPLFFQTKEKLRSLGIEGILFDLDDTLIYTSEIFRMQMEVYTEEVAREMAIDPQLLYKTLSAMSDEEYKRMGVNPLRWKAVTDKLAEIFDDKSGKIVEKLHILLHIYQTVPRVRPAARVFLETVKSCHIKQGLVTHANEEWTYFKLDQLELWNYFHTVLIADENGHKGEWHWRRAMEMLEVEPEKCLVVGDSLRGDIIPAASLGARTIWMPSPWSVYREGTVPEGTVQIDELVHIWDGLMKLE